MEIGIVKVQEFRQGEAGTAWMEKKLQNSTDEQFIEWFKESGAVTCPSQIEMMTGVTNPKLMNTQGKALLARQIAGETLEKAWYFIHGEAHEDDLDELFCLKTIRGEEYLLAMGWEALGFFILKKAQVLSEV